MSDTNMNSSSVDPNLGVDELFLDVDEMPPPPHPQTEAKSSSKRPAPTSKALYKKRAKPTPVLKAKTMKRFKEDVFNDAERLLGSPKSLIYQPETNIQAILQHPSAKSSLASSPNEYVIGELSTDAVSRAVTLFKDDGLSGRQDEEWAKDAVIAHQERSGGRFDEMLKDKFQDNWGEKSEEMSGDEDQQDVPASIVEEGHRAREDVKDRAEEEGTLPAEYDRHDGNVYYRNTFDDDEEDQPTARGHGGFSNGRFGHPTSYNTFLPETSSGQDRSGAGSSRMDGTNDRSVNVTENDRSNPTGFYQFDQFIPPPGTKSLLEEVLGNDSVPREISYEVGTLCPTQFYSQSQLLGPPLYDNWQFPHRLPNGEEYQYPQFQPKAGVTYPTHPVLATASPTAGASVTQLMDVGPLNNWDKVTRPRRGQLCSFTSDSKMEQLFKKDGSGDSIIKEGDKILCTLHDRQGNTITKEALITRWNGSNPRRNGSFMTIAIPPADFPTSQLSIRADIVFPNPQYPSSLTGVSKICEAFHRVGSTYALRGGISWSWSTLSISRNGRNLGTLMDLRQAWQFRRDESDYQDQLIFNCGRKRRNNNSLVEEGYNIIDTLLFRKIRADELHHHNLDLIVDLGAKLNAGLAACAEPGFMIIMLDNRMQLNDGIPNPDGVDLEAVYQEGPQTFPTEYLRTIASSKGWSRGHANIGAYGLGKGLGESFWGHKGYFKDDNLDEWPSINKFGRPCYEDRTPAGYIWNPTELEKTHKFLADQIRGKIRHYPTTRHLSRQDFGLPTHQYRLKGRCPRPADRYHHSNWEIDPSPTIGDILPPRLLSLEKLQRAIGIGSSRDFQENPKPSDARQVGNRNSKGPTKKPVGRPRKEKAQHQPSALASQSNKQMYQPPPTPVNHSMQQMDQQQSPSFPNHFGDPMPRFESIQEPYATFSNAAQGGEYPYLGSSPTLSPADLGKLASKEFEMQVASLSTAENLSAPRMCFDLANMDPCLMDGSSSDSLSSSVMTYPSSAPFNVASSVTSTNYSQSSSQHKLSEPIAGNFPPFSLNGKQASGQITNLAHEQADTYPLNTIIPRTEAQYHSLLGTGSIFEENHPANSPFRSPLPEKPRTALPDSKPQTKRRPRAVASDDSKPAESDIVPRKKKQKRDNRDPSLDDFMEG